MATLTKSVPANTSLLEAGTDTAGVLTTASITVGASGVYGNVGAHNVFSADGIGTIVLNAGAEAMLYSDFTSSAGIGAVSITDAAGFSQGFVSTNLNSADGIASISIAA